MIYPVFDCDLDADPGDPNDAVGKECSASYTPPGGPAQAAESYGHSNVVTGNVAKHFTDFAIAGRGPTLNLTRYYNSLAGATVGVFGNGWSSILDMHVNTAGSVVSVTQPTGAIVTYQAGAGTLTPTAPRNTAVLTKLANGTFTFVLHQLLTYTFDASGALTSITDANGYQQTLTHPTTSQTVLTDTAGRTITLVLAAGLVSSATDPLGRKFTYGYIAGDLTAVTDPIGAVTTLNYYTAHRLHTLTNPVGAVSTYTYDTVGRVATEADPLHRTATFDYTSIPNATKITDPLGNVTVENYQDGLVTSRTAGYGSAAPRTISYEYDPVTFLVISTVDPLHDETDNWYDNHGNLLATADPLGNTTTYTYNAADQITSVIDPSYQETDTSYDPHGNPKTISRVLAQTGQTATTTNTYAGQPGDITSVTDPTGRTATNGYDTYGDVNKVTDPAGNISTATFDTDSELATATSPRGGVTTDTRDLDGRITVTRDALGHTTTTAYDLAGRTRTVTDGLGHVTTPTYDLATQLTKTTYADGSVESTGFDADGHIASQTDANGKTTLYGYNLFHEVIKRTDAIGRITTYGYDNAGRRTKLTDPAAHITTTGYDADGHPSTVTYSDGITPNVSYSYDFNGRRIAMTDGAGTTSYVYDSFGRLSILTRPDQTTIDYAYDLAGRLTALTYPNGNAVQRGYDTAGRLSTVTDWLGKTTAFGYDLDSNLTTTIYPNTITGTNAYNTADQLTGITYKAGTTVRASFSYTRNAIGQISASTTTLAGSATSTSYGYSPRNRLTSAGTGSTYSYDPNGNISHYPNNATATYDGAGQLGSLTPPAPATATTYLYDTNGNRTKATTGTAVITYTYDAANRLTAYHDAAHTASYAYDGDGLRVFKTVNGASTAFGWDVSGAPALLLSAGTTNYIYGATRQPVEQIQGTTATYLHQDQQGTVRLTTNPAGANVSTATYDAYGRLTSATGTQSLLGYDGEYSDGESGLTYLRARYYEPSTGQLLQPDPAAAITRTAHQYASGDPVNRSDPSGLTDNSDQGSVETGWVFPDSQQTLPTADETQANADGQGDPVVPLDESQPSAAADGLPETEAESPLVEIGKEFLKKYVEEQGKTVPEEFTKDLLAEGPFKSLVKVVPFVSDIYDVGSDLYHAYQGQPWAEDLFKHSFGIFGTILDLPPQEKAALEIGAGAAFRLINLGLDGAMNRYFDWRDNQASNDYGVGPQPVSPNLNSWVMLGGMHP